MTHKYKLKYTMDMEDKKEGFTPDDVTKETEGLTDACIFISMLFPDNGSYSQMVFSFDGRNKLKKIPSIDVFKAWSLLGIKLSNDEELTGFQKELVKKYAAEIRSIMKKLLEIDGRH